MPKPFLFKFPLLLLAVSLALFLAACGSENPTTPSNLNATPSVTRTPASGLRAAELTGTQGWVNSEPLTMVQLRGKTVLIDFWTYTCVNCIRTFPYLKTWWSKYADDGLVIVGVHTPEFAFEHDLGNVRQAVAEYGIGWPVVQDNNYDTWDAYNNQYWPAKYLIDQDGVIRYQHFGEGAYAETEDRIRALLQEAGADLSKIPAAGLEDQELDHAFKNTIGADITSELYGGHERGCSFASFYSNSSIDSPLYCQSKDKVATYADPGQHKNHKLYLQGPWLAEPEAVRHARETQNFEDYLVLRFAAKSVNVVLSLPPTADQPFKVHVTLNGKNLDQFNKGADVVIEPDGRSYLVVDKPRMYHVVEAPEYGTYELKLASNSADFAVYAFTFGVYESGI
ncbi:MAG: thioredoxin family protein [SAR202 cluster bacterium]|nr:thioredoxin family protein [SAR202 cluster bacterium]